jgi:hypothetical protein
MSAPEHSSRRAGRWRRILARTLTVIGVLLAFVALFANFIRLQLLDEDEFRETSAELIENEAIRDQLALTLVERLYDNVDVKQEFESQLPEDLQALAGPLAVGSRQLAERAAEALLARPAVQTLWIEASSTAQQALVDVLEGGGDVVSTEEGVVVIDLRELVLRLSEELGVGARAAELIPEDAGQVVLLESDELGAIQDLTKALKAMALWIWVLALIAWALAIWLARGYRRIEVRAIAVGLVVVGVGVLLLRTLTGNYLVSELVKTESAEPAADAVWDIITRLLKDAGWTMTIIGIVALVGAWFTGPGRRAREARELAAPYLARPGIVYGGYAILVLILVWWGPTAQWRHWLSALVMIALGAIGLEAVRRVTAHDFPDAVAADSSGPAPRQPEG